MRPELGCNCVSKENGIVTRHVDELKLAKLGSCSDMGVKMKTR